MQVVGQHGLCLHRLMATGARVSNAYPTCQSLGHSPPKGGLTPDTVLRGHLNGTKGFTVTDGDASD